MAKEISVNFQRLGSVDDMVFSEVSILTVTFPNEHNLYNAIVSLYWLLSFMGPLLLGFFFILILNKFPYFGEGGGLLLLLVLLLWFYCNAWSG